MAGTRRYKGVARGTDVTRLWRSRPRGRYPDGKVATKLRHVIATEYLMWEWAGVN